MQDLFDRVSYSLWHPRTQIDSINARERKVNIKEVVIVLPGLVDKPKLAFWFKWSALEEGEAAHLASSTLEIVQAYIAHFLYSDTGASLYGVYKL
jgi:hypothetical protein